MKCFATENVAVEMFNGYQTEYVIYSTKIQKSVVCISHVGCNFVLAVSDGGRHARAGATTAHQPIISKHVIVV